MPYMNCHEGEAQCMQCGEWFDRTTLTMDGFCSAECEMAAEKELFRPLLCKPCRKTFDEVTSCFPVNRALESFCESCKEATNKKFKELEPWAYEDGEVKE